mmetsp:Transcript_32122/g.80828  ORF Transcript_32122/g.80828 Transcript_32122/m.80828 type:complete len:245 (+) Transcript_32122:154-888(+)
MFLIDHTTCVCLIERLVGEEAIEQGQGSGGLVHRHHVAGLVHLQEGKAAAALLGGGSASHTTGHGGSVCIRCVVPSMVRLSIEGCVATPGQSLGPCLVTDPIADKIYITSVDHYAHAAFKHGLKYLLVVAHPVTGKHNINSGIAGLPGLHLIGHMQRFASGVKVQECLDVSKVVTKGAVTAGNTDIIRVQSGIVIGSGLHKVAVVISRDACVGVLLAGLGHLDTGRHMVNHFLVRVLRDTLNAV